MQQVDPAAAARLHPHDQVRLIRALEVYELSGRRLSEWQDEHRFAGEAVPMVSIGVELPRRELYERLNRRCAAMLAEGLIEEVQGLWSRGYGPELPALQSIGYREVGRYLCGECTLDEARDDMARATRKYAKRQLTWFRNQMKDWPWESPDTALNKILTAFGSEVSPARP